MFWLFAMAATAGLILGVPLLIRTLDGVSPNPVPPSPTSDPQAPGHEHPTMRRGPAASLTGFAAFGLLTAGIGGLVALAFDPSVVVMIAVAVCLGLAAGAVHPEILGLIGRKRLTTNA